MAGTKDTAPLLALARRQHWVVSRPQLLALGYSRHAIEHMLRVGILHRLFRGVYAVGRPEVTRDGIWMAAVLVGGERAVLSHESAAALWGIRPDRLQPPEITVPHGRRCRCPGIVIHVTRRIGRHEVTARRGLRLTAVARTVIDLTPRLPPPALERMINEADRLGLITPDRLRRALDADGHRPGEPALRTRLDRRTFRLTASELERLFLAIVRRAGLPLPLTRQMLNGFEVDFYWPDLGLVVETDGLRYHRTPAQQSRDRLRDQAHTAAGLTCLRFTHEQIAFEAPHVERTLLAVARRLRSARRG